MRSATEVHTSILLVFSEIFTLFRPWTNNCTGQDITLSHGSSQNFRPFLRH